MSANWLYHEKQIGQELDRLESELLLGGAKGAGEAGNVDGSGMFSIQ
ncbi:hypothetical protein HaLaN_15706, partial [Haematococcus lacustris]